MQAKENAHLQGKATGFWSSTDPPHGIDQQLALPGIHGQMAAFDGVSEHELIGALKLPSS